MRVGRGSRLRNIKLQARLGRHIKITDSTSHSWEKRTWSSGIDSNLCKELQKCSFL